MNRIRSKRERDPSEGRMRKRLVTQKNQRSNEKENKPNEYKIDAIKIESNSDHLSLHQINQLNLPIKLEQANESPNSLSTDDQLDEQMELIEINSQSNSQSNQTLKQKLVSLNNSKFVIEEGDEDEELVESADLDGSEYDYDGEDLSENDENYCANDYPDERSDDELDYYRSYEDDYEREMLEKFEKINWNNDESDHSEEY